MDTIIGSGYAVGFLSTSYIYSKPKPNRFWVKQDCSTLKEICVMSINYMEKESSKKKYLAPLVVIMLCLVAITGAAYAYSTSVTGNGDIAAKYSIVDIYENDAGEYVATSDFDITNETLNFYTVTDKTGKSPVYTAYLNDGEEIHYLYFSTYMRINTENTSETHQKFHIETFKCTYTAPEGCGDIQVSGADPGTEFVISDFKIYTDSGKTTPVNRGNLDDNTIYYVEFSLYVTGGNESTLYFCQEDELDKVTAKINTFNTTDNEIAIKITVAPGRDD